MKDSPERIAHLLYRTWTASTCWQLHPQYNKSISRSNTFNIRWTVIKKFSTC